jgi:toxin YoeB
LEFDLTAFEDLAWWVEHDRRMALRILRIIQQLPADPTGGIGKPEPLKHQFAGC